jgi:ribosome recycling factor
MSADLGLNPSNDGKIIRIPIPPLTEERRKQFVKKIYGMGEDAKTAIRQIRRDSNEEIKKLQKEGGVSEDDAHRALDEVQKITDKHTGEIDTLCKNKEQELMEV